ncbi:cell wall hydrolase [Amorphus coralli]|uniref:cell wall hydrolase n=1 Tax=Amorphus coralli TaxID=340680 RepID=UPI0004199D2A|nr:cell wall hydrolase [Amorphus coralli]
MRFPAKKRRRRASCRPVLRRLALAAGLVVVIGGQTGQQDVLAYMLSQQDSPRYMARIVAAPYGSEIEPTFVYSRDGAATQPGAASAVGVEGIGAFETLAFADGGGAVTVGDLPVRSRADAKGNRLTTMKASVDNEALGSGAVATAVSLLTPGTVQDFPRVAFVRPAPFDQAPAAESLLASAPGRADRAVHEARILAAATAATSASLASAYAPQDAGPDINAPFEALLGDSAGTARSAGPLDHWWSDRPLPKEVTDKRQVRCLAEAVYFEARSEGRKGQMAVAQVVMNRLKNPAYPDSLCGVVYQNKSWHNRCQFSFACDRVRDVVTDQASWKQAMEIAEGYTSQKMWLSEIGASTHYHATYVRPAWAPHMKKIERVGLHIFYLTYGGDWT